MRINNDRAGGVSCKMYLADIFERNACKIVICGKIMIMRADVNIVYIEKQMATASLCHRIHKFPLRHLIFGKGDIA